MNNRQSSTGLWLLLALASAAAQLAAAQTSPAQTSPAQAAPPAAATPAPASIPATAPAPTRPAANYVAVGVFYYEQGRYDEAYVAYRAASEADPNNTDALLGLGRSQVKLRLYAPALETLRRLVALAPQNVSAYIALSQAYQQQYVGSSDRSALGDNLSAALKVLAEAEAVIGAQTTPDRDLNLSKVWNERGYVYRLQGQIAPAIEAFRRASELNPDNSIMLYNLGDMYYAAGDLPAALNYLQQAVIADPRDPYNRAYYAKLLALSGNTGAARPEAAQAARLAPTNAYAVGQYGVVSYLAKDMATARAQLTQAIKLEPLRYPEFYYYLGRLNLDSGDLKAARDALTRAAALGSLNPEYTYYLGLSYERGGGNVAPDRVRARENYERALKLNPAFRLAQEGLARLK